MNHSQLKTTFLVDTEALTKLSSNTVYVLYHFTDLPLVDAPEYQASCTMGTGSFPGVESGQGMTLTPNPLRVPRSKNRVQLYLYSP
jgi:hypothetical protein